MFRRALSWLFRELFQGLELERNTALSGVAWGVWVIAFGTFDSAPSYHYLVVSAAWLTGPARAEWFWGSLSILAGSLHLYGIFADRRRLRMGAALFATTLWSALTVAFVLNEPATTRAVTYLALAYANASLYYQVGTHRRGARGQFNVRVPLSTGGTLP